MTIRRGVPVFAVRANVGGFVMIAALTVMGCEATNDVASGEAGLVWPITGPAPLNHACEACHVEEAAQWRSSLHRDAFTNAAFTASFAREPTPFCQGCHAPHADPGRPPPGWAAENGVTCVSCHVTGGQVRAGATARSSVESPHPLARSVEFSGPQACAGCHEFAFPPSRRRTPGALMQRTLSEHARSGHADVGCAECHMNPADGGSRLDHSFAVSRNEPLLRASLTVAARRRGPDSLRLELTPVGVGHALPTGDLFRRLALVVEARDDRGASVGATTEYLARHFPARLYPGSGRIEPDPPEPDDRLTGPTLRELTVPGAQAGHTLLWRVVYQRVDQRDSFAPGRSTLAGEVVLASGELAP